MDGLLRKVTIPLVAIVVGPAAEELLFRGALQGGLRRVYPHAVVVPVVASLFASAHLSPQLFLSMFVVAVVVTGLRAASGSIIPALLAHIAFNAVPIAGLMLGLVSVTPDPQPLPALVSVVGVGGSALLVATMLWLARRSAWAQKARLEDLA
jgi:membrane protease YdiL (CAAX protease family)